MSAPICWWCQHYRPWPIHDRSYTHVCDRQRPEFPGVAACEDFHPKPMPPDEAEDENKYHPI